MPQKPFGAIIVEMKKDIWSKLRRELNEPISSERQVVYILVELRKLLELSGSDEHFPALNFYCDWALHAVLDQEGAQEDSSQIQCTTDERLRS